MVDVKADGHIISQAVVMRKDALLAAGGFRPELRWHCDWFCNWVVAFRHGVCHVPDPLAVMRVVSGSYSTGTRSWDDQRGVLDRMLTLLKDPAYRDVAPYFARSAVMFA